MLTSVGDLAGIATGGLVTKLRHGGSDLGQALDGGSVTWSLIFGQGDSHQLAGLGVLDLCGDGDDLVVEQAGLLGNLSSPEALDGVFILLSPRDVEVVADILRRLDHGLLAVGSFLVRLDFGRERHGAAGGACAVGHAFAAERNADVDAAVGDLAGNVLHGLQPAGAESVDAAGCGGVGEAGCKHGRSHFVCRGEVADISQADVLNERGVNLALLHELLQ